MTPLSPHRSTPRPPNPARQVTVRDRLLLRFVSAVGCARTDHIAILLGTSLDMVRRRIRILRDFQLLVVHVTAMHEPSWLTCTPRARAVLCDTFGLREDEVYCPRTLPAQLDHHALSVGLHATLACAASRAKQTLTVEIEHERRIRERLGASSAGASVPDAIALVTGDGWRRAVAIEADAGSESPRILVAKVRAYAEARAGGAAIRGDADWQVAFVFATERRRNRVALALADAALCPGWVHLGVATQLDDRAVLGPVWRALDFEATTGELRLAPGNPFRPVLSARHDRHDAPVPR